MNDIKIMVVDDQQLVRSGLVHMLGDMPGLQVVGQAESGEQALDLLEVLANQDAIPDVVLMDLRMPGIGGLEATRRMLRRQPEMKVVAVTGCDEQPFPQRFLESGASGFITKEAGIEEVALAIRMAQKGKRYISQQVAQEMALNPTIIQDNAEHGSPFEKLSERELQIALMIIEGMKTSDIAVQLSLSPKSVNTYRYRMFEKLKINSNMELAMLATRHGLLEVHARKE